MIFVFSGTGNTLFVARQLSKHLDQKCIALRRDTLVQLPDVALDDKEPVIWAFPVYAWGIPPVIEKLIATMQPSKAMSRAVHHAVITYGDDAGTIGRQWRHLLAAKGLRPGSVYGVRMPNTYICLPGFDVDSTELTEQKLADASETVTHIATDIAANQNGDNHTDSYRPGAMPGIKSGVLRPFFHKFLMSPSRFHSTDACIGCGKCARQCPTGNITMTCDKPVHPQWGSNCAFCLACYHVCPRHAVAYGNTTAHKGQKKIIYPADK